MYPVVHQSITLLQISSQMTTFKSTQTRKAITIFYQVICHGNYIIYLLECVMCKIQYLGRSETSFNIRLDNHKKDIKKQTPKACKHFNSNEHTFSKHSANKFITIEQLQKYKHCPHQNTLDQKS